MPHDVRPTTPDDLPALSRFLADGFHAPADAAFAAPDVLRWKYFDPRGVDAGDAHRSYLARDPATGAVVGHLGVCTGRFRGGGLPAEGISTLHMIDWLSTSVGAGASLMRRAHQTTETQYGFGGSAAGRRVGERGGYALAALVPVVRRVLRPVYRLKDGSQGVTGRALRAAKDVVGLVRRPPRRPVAPVEPRRVEAFGPEVEPILSAYARHAVFTTRRPDFLNHVLRYPRGGVSGWQLWRGGGVRGFAVLGVVDAASAREGRVVECLLDDPDDADLWLAAAVALAGELKRLGADVAVAVASTDWSARAFRAAGFGPSHDLEFRPRDRAHRLPTGSPFHLSPLEADYGYT